MPSAAVSPLPVAEPKSPRARPAAVRYLALLFELAKVRITLFVTLSVATGWIAFKHRLGVDLLLPVLGVFVLACGSAVLNQVQEVRLDGQMARTRNRPIPSGRIRRDTALFIALVLTCTGLYLLGSVDRFAGTVVLLGLASLVWYNGVYYVLKRRTPFAVVPGSLVGAIPPVIGWCSAGGILTDGRILEVAAFFFIWQIPHFWLLLVLFGREYGTAGMPTLTARVSPPQLGRMTYAWVAATVMTGLALAAGRGFGVPWNLLILVASVSLALHALAILRRPDDRKTAVRLFLRINAYALVVMAAVVLSALTHPGGFRP